MSGWIDNAAIVAAYQAKEMRFTASDFGLKMHMFYAMGADHRSAYAIELRDDGKKCCCPLGVLAAGLIVPMPDRDACRQQHVGELVARALNLSPAYVHGFTNRVDGGKATPIQCISRGEAYTHDFSVGWLDAGQALIAIRKAGVVGTEFAKLPG